MSQKKSFHSAEKWSQEYHFKFNLVSSCPKIVYWYGNIDLLNSHLLSIVWPRRCSPYARQVLEDLFKMLPTYDLVTVSGLADGVDMMCHDMSMSTSIPTIAVLGWGLNRFLQSKSREKIDEIVNKWWLVLSEFDCDKSPERYTFPQRNRIVAGLADCVFLPEAWKKSWSLITADFARHMHKPVYGAPSTMFSLSSHGLLDYMQQWLVVPVVQRDKMLDKHFGKKTTIESWSLFDLSEDAWALKQLLKKNTSWLTVNSLVSLSGLGIQEIMQELSMMEILWTVKQEGGVWKMG